MGVFRCVIRHLYHSLLFIIRLPRPLIHFIVRLFFAEGKSDRYLRPDRSMEYEQDYDSTWEDEQDHEESPESLFQRSNNAYRNLYAAKDMQNFRQRSRNMLEDLKNWTKYVNDGLLNLQDEDLPNLRFYRNQCRFEPEGVLIEDFHKYWFADYYNLEHVHSFIQWLFPIQEKGLNYASRELSPTEIMLFRDDEEVKKRLLTSYKLMLDFYGIKLVDEKTGEVTRAPNWTERFKNLNRNTHNNLRITRIIKCLGLLGFEHYQAPLVHFFLKETLVKETLPRVKQSALDYFMFAVLDKTQRKDLIRFAFKNFKPKKDFVWCPSKICNKILTEKESQEHICNVGPNEGMSNDSTSLSNRNNLMESQAENKEENGTSEDTSLSGGNDENVLDECQESEKPALPIPVAGNANISDINKDEEALLGGDSQHDSHIVSADAKARNERIPKPEQTANSDENGSDDDDPSKRSEGLSDAENFGDSDENTQTFNHSTACENAVKGTTSSGRNSGSERQDQGLISQRESKENDSQVNLKSGSGAIETNSGANSSKKNTESDDLQEGSEQNLSERTKEKEDPVDLSMEDMPVNNPLTSNNKEYSDSVDFKDREDTESKETDEKKKDPVDPSMEDDPEDRITDMPVNNPAASNNKDYSDSTDVKDRENTESEDYRSDENPSQVIPAKETEVGEGCEETSVEGKKTEMGCVTDEGNAVKETMV